MAGRFSRLFSPAASRGGTDHRPPAPPPEVGLQLYFSSIAPPLTAALFQYAEFRRAFRRHGDFRSGFRPGYDSFGRLTVTVVICVCAVATNGRVIYALNPESEEILVVQKTTERWAVTDRILLKDFKSRG